MSGFAVRVIVLIKDLIQYITPLGYASVQILFMLFFQIFVIEESLNTELHPFY